jgi:hypothetical protein
MPSSGFPPLRTPRAGPAHDRAGHSEAVRSVHAPALAGHPCLAIEPDTMPEKSVSVCAPARRIKELLVRALAKRVGVHSTASFLALSGPFIFATWCH